MSQMVFDEKLSRRLEANYSRRDFQRRRQLVHTALGVQPGERIIDVGCGPGFYVAELSDRVGTAGEVVGVDISPDMLGIAQRRSGDRPNVTLHEASASALPVSGASFDAAISVQVLEFVEDPDAALAEMHRVLRPGGRLVIWDVDWSTVSWHSADPERMSRVLRTWDGHLRHPALPRTLARRLRAAGFEATVAEGHTFATIEFTPDSYAVAMMPAIETYVAAQDGPRESDAHAWADEQRRLGEAGEFFFASIQFCFTATRP